MYKLRKKNLLNNEVNHPYRSTQQSYETNCHHDHRQQLPASRNTSNGSHYPSIYAPLKTQRDHNTNQIGLPAQKAQRILLECDEDQQIQDEDCHKSKKEARMSVNGWIEPLAQSHKINRKVGSKVQTLPIQQVNNWKSLNQQNIMLPFYLQKLNMYAQKEEHTIHKLKSRLKNLQSPEKEHKSVNTKEIFKSKRKTQSAIKCSLLDNINTKRKSSLRIIDLIRERQSQDPKKKLQEFLKQDSSKADKKSSFQAKRSKQIEERSETACLRSTSRENSQFDHLINRLRQSRNNRTLRSILS